MDEKQDGPAKRSAIPRPVSRLPLPKTVAAAASTSIRPSASRESLKAPTQLRNPKLRTSISRDHLPGGTLRKRESIGNFSRSQNAQNNVGGAVGQPSAGTKLPIQPGQPSNPVTRPSATTFPGGPRQTDTSFKKPTLSTRLASKNSFSGRSSISTDSRPGSAPRADIPPETDDLSPLDNVDNSSAYDTIRATPRKARPSLSERTIETLTQLSNSPALKHKGSSFFDPEAMRRPPSRPGSRLGSGSRPGSSYQSDKSLSGPQSRPGSSGGPDEGFTNFRASTNTFKMPLKTISGTPVRGRPSNAKTVRTPSARPSLGQAWATSASAQARSRTPSPEKRPFNGETATPTYGSKTVAARPLKSKPSLVGLFKKPNPASAQTAAPSAASRKASLASHRSSTSGEGTNPSRASTTSTALTVDSSESASAQNTRKSSAALREQIAKARAAKRTAATREVSGSVSGLPDDTPVIPTDNTFDFGLTPDPFGQHRGGGDSQKKVIESRIIAARSSGRLNIAALALREIPQEVMDMYELTSIGGHDGSWAETVDLTRFVAADNEIEMIQDDIFPDVNPSDMADDEDSKGNIFGGLETLDLHGNMLICLPMGLRRLHLLTSLNLSHNRVTNNALDVISQITALRDLKLGGNLFYGPLDPSFTKLENLEIADLHGNNITALPLNMENLSKLRILNISENAFESLVFEPLAKLPLTELVARKNKLSGVLIEDAVEALPNLQILDVSSNSVSHLISPSRSGSIHLPALQQLCLSMNRVQALPDVSSWTSMLTLSADENSINSIPEGFTSLTVLRSVDFSSNDIRAIPSEVGRMDNLAMLRLSGNPLRDKKFTTASTEDIKATLLTRLAPPETFAQPEEQLPQTVSWTDVPQPAGQPAEHATKPVDDQASDHSDMDDFATPPTSAPGSPARSRSHTLSNQVWPVKRGGVLDRSETESSSLHPVVCSRIASENSIVEVHLQRNLFMTFPDSLSFFADTLTTLSLAHNHLVGETYLGASDANDGLDLPALRELNLASNRISGLVSLTAHLRAPSLQKLDMTLNRISALPAGGQLRAAFPALEVLLVANNHLSELDPESIRGMRIVDVSNNDIDHLNPRIGLLGGVGGGLERLEAMGNRFRVPRFTVLERGTEATLRWLRGRVPVADMAAWKATNSAEGEGDDDVD